VERKRKKKVLIAVNHRVVASSPTKSHILIKSTIGRTNNSIPRVEKFNPRLIFFLLLVYANGTGEGS